MYFRSFLSRLLVAVAAVGVLSGCANRAGPTDYFEPSGDAKIISVPAGGPQNVAQVTYGSNATMNVRATIAQGVASVNLVLVMRSGASAMKFTGRRLIFEVGAAREEREGAWDVSLVEARRPRTERVAFDAELKPSTATGAPEQEGVVNLGIYQISLVVPNVFQAAPEFRLTIPALEGGAPTTLTFLRRNAG